jgi:hypothetical protein
MFMKAKENKIECTEAALGNNGERTIQTTTKMVNRANRGKTFSRAKRPTISRPVLSLLCSERKALARAEAVLAPVSDDTSAFPTPNRFGE